MSRVDTAAWEAAGIYDPGGPGAPERQALLAYLEARGATLGQMVEAHGLNNLPCLAGDLALGPPKPKLSV